MPGLLEPDSLAGFQLLSRRKVSSKKYVPNLVTGWKCRQGDQIFCRIPPHPTAPTPVAPTQDGGIKAGEQVAGEIMTSEWKSWQGFKVHLARVPYSTLTETETQREAGSVSKTTQ